MSQPSFAPGETLSTTIVFENPGRADTADAYIGVLLPDRTVVTLTVAGTFTPGHADDLSTFAPVRTGVGLTSPSASTIRSFLVYQWTGAELRGEYTFFVLVVRAGAFAAGRLTPNEILALATASFTFH